jgi:hypothetical protein
MAQPFSDLDLQQLINLAHDNTRLVAFFDALETMVTLCRAVEPLASELRRLRSQVLMDEQVLARSRDEVHRQDIELSGLRAQVEALQHRLRAPTAA